MAYISEISTEAPKEERGKTEGRVYQLLEKLGISYERVDNDVVESMEECVEIAQVLGTEIRKTLFLRNKQKTLFIMVVLPADKKLDSKALEKRLGASRLSFASGELMEEYLGTKPGSASIMGLLNDSAGQVRLIIDKEVADAEWFGCNPGVNTSHLKFKTSDLLNKLLPEINHRAEIMEL